MDAVRGVHGATQGRVELAVARSDVAAAERLVADLHEPDPGPNPG